MISSSALKAFLAFQSILCSTLPHTCWAFQSSSPHQSAVQRSAQLEEQIHLLAKMIALNMDIDFGQELASLLGPTRDGLPFSHAVHQSLQRQLFDKKFSPSIGVSVDPKGEAASNASMVYVWTPNVVGASGWPGAFRNASALMAGPPLELGDLGRLEDEMEIGQMAKDRAKRAPKGGGMGGGGRGGGGGGRGGGGRGSSAARSSSAGRSRSGSFGASSFAGIGGARPHVWIFAHSGGNYKWMDDSAYDWRNDKEGLDMRMEISLCFGRHPARESCSAKVDAMLEKMANERSGTLKEKELLIKLGSLVIVLGIAAILLCFFFDNRQQRQRPMYRTPGRLI